MHELGVEVSADTDEAALDDAVSTLRDRLASHFRECDKANVDISKRPEARNRGVRFHISAECACGWDYDLRTVQLVSVTVSDV